MNLNFIIIKMMKNTTVLDEVYISRLFKNPKESGKKVVFIKIIGTHFDYNKRYPPSLIINL
jgi:glucan phosphoethanolaminetransferase (alkaline phosphatase superfamily)